MTVDNIGSLEADIDSKCENKNCKHDASQHSYTKNRTLSRCLSWDGRELKNCPCMRFKHKQKKLIESKMRRLFN